LSERKDFRETAAGHCAPVSDCADRAAAAAEFAKIRQAAVTQEADVKRATIKEAIALEEQLAAKEEALAVTRLKEAQLKLKANGDDKEALDAVAQAEAAVYLARSQRFEATLRFQKEIERLDDEEAARKIKQAEDVAKWEQDILDKMEKDAQERAKKTDAAAEKKKLEEAAAEEGGGEGGGGHGDGSSSR
jgi:hypothetical protein